MHFAGAATVVGALPNIGSSAMRPLRNQRIVVLVELKGGNDGFNTLVPYDDDEYNRLRPKVRIDKRALIPLKDGFGMNKALKPLKSHWDMGDMAWIHGVGYPNGILSHFRSMDVWDSGSTHMGGSAPGWLSKVLPRYKKGLHGIAITRDQGAMGPLTGSQINTVSMQNPRTFLSQARLVDDVTLSYATPALAHITKTQQQLVGVGQQIVEKLRQPARLPVGFSKGPLGHGLKSVAQMILSGIDAPVYKVTQDGFDTHVGQLGTQENSLYHLGNGLSSFAEAMKRGGMWDNVLVVTYSEFGRRIVENKGRGTDHGTASTHLVMGGRVRPGFYGRHPNFKQLDHNRNVAHTTDFRSIYATLAQRWWQQNNPWKGYPILPFV